MEYFDIAFLSKIDLGELIKIFSKYTNIPISQIMDEEEFMDNIGSDKTLIGIEITYQEQDFRTWIVVRCLGYEFDSLSLVNLGLTMAKEFKTDVAIEDVLWEGDKGISAMMILSPDMTYRKAYFFQDKESICTLTIHDKGEYNIAKAIQKLEGKDSGL